jgi:hypothetical protein
MRGQSGGSESHLVAFSFAREKKIAISPFGTSLYIISTSIIQMILAMSHR